MKILFIVDGRSPIALNWIRYFVDHGHEVHLASMFPCQSELPLASLTVIPVVFSGAVTTAKVGEDPSWKSNILRSLATPRTRTWLRHQFVPRSLPIAAIELSSLIKRVQPDLVHAMRIPYEGMLVALAYDQQAKLNPPLLISVWGNDFTLHAPATKRLTFLTNLTLERASALHTDCDRDQRLAVTWGFDSGKPATVLPGAGGIQLDTFYPGESPRAPIVINPRGLRAYVRTDSFFRSIPLVLQRYPEAKFICPTMKGRDTADKWVNSLGIEGSVELLPRQSRAEMGTLFRQAQVVVSPSTHDGTPNTLLEAMACGCTPVAGDLESIREWITPGINGLLVDPGDPQALAEAICEVLGNAELRERAKDLNQVIIRERAEYKGVMEKAISFYGSLIPQQLCA
jgi:glycosyltransferase involved in cell wall biosynthesis